MTYIYIYIYIVVDGKIHYMFHHIKLIKKKHFK